MKFDYEAEDDSNITISVGDIVVIADKSDADWWEGHVEGKPDRVGFFPASFVEMLEEAGTGGADMASPAASSPVPSVSSRAPSASSPVSPSSLSPNAPWWGFKAFDHKVDGKKRGVKVECIEGGPATAAGLRSGDVVVSVGGDTVKSRRKFVEVGDPLTENPDANISIVLSCLCFVCVLCVLCVCFVCALCVLCVCALCVLCVCVCVLCFVDVLCGCFVCGLCFVFVGCEEGRAGGW